MSTVTHLNPPELHSSPAFSQATVAEAGRALCGARATSPG